MTSLLLTAAAQADSSLQGSNGGATASPVKTLSKSRYDSTIADTVEPDLIATV